MMINGILTNCKPIKHTWIENNSVKKSGSDKNLEHFCDKKQGFKVESNKLHVF